MSDFDVAGGCLCGAVRYRVTAKPLAAYYCHCTMCQKNGSGPFMVGATVSIESFAFTKGEPKVYESSPGLVRLSCDRCGSALGMKGATDPKVVDFGLGCLDDPNAIKPEFHQYTSTQVEWCEIADGLPRHANVAPVISKIWAELVGRRVSE